VPTTSELDIINIFEPSPNATVVLDRAYRVVAANTAFLTLTRSTWEAIANQPLLSCLAITDVAGLRASFDRVFANKHREELPVVPYLAKQFVSASNTPVYDHRDGSLRWVLHQIADVTELQQSPAAIALLGTGILGRAGKTSAELVMLRHLFDQAPGFTCFLRGSEHRFELVNAAYLNLIGKNSSILGKTVSEALPEIRDQGFIELLDGVYRTCQPHVGRGVEIMLARGPGQLPELRILDFVYQPIVVDGASIGIFVQGQDITDARKVEAERTRLAAEYRELFELAPQQVWTARPDGQLDRVNQQTVRYLGRSQEQILGDGWQSVVHPDDLPHAVAAWLESLSSGEPYQLDFRLLGADGAYRWFLTRATAVRSADGSILTWIGTNTDIDLARRDHEELVARAAYEERLIGIVSHDLRNPLSTISLAIPLLEGEDLGPSARKAVGYIKTAATRSERLITDLLDFAQARSGNFPISPEPTNLPALVRAAVEGARLVSGPRAVALEHRGPPTGTWDEGRLTQVIANLVGNAFQHAPPDAMIRVRSVIDGDRASIDVFNEGPAIRAEDLPRLFDPFARGKNAVTKQGRSIGLGLFIANQIAVAHGGAISVKSVAGEGTTFSVNLPTKTVRA
jgi:PAS domain S-box-containing protein